MIDGLPDWFTIPALILGVILGALFLAFARGVFRRRH